ncbi:MAG TPA: ABC transporter substrate-binding protein [Candidatus Polarisedimenticolaceae bacterium]|nr:ABC transporter substrate-binding protein [Candidatus Polarisedimenticolaceae bacterium]
MRGAALLLLVLLAGCTTEPGTSIAPSPGGTLVLGSISDVDAWNEAVSAQSFAANLHRLLFLRLAREKGKGGFGPEGYDPELAESWSFGEDGKSLTFHLRDARWSDGTPLTAEDVRFTWQAQTSPDVGWVGADAKKNVTDVTVSDPRTVTFHFARVTPFLFANAVEGGILPRHAFGKVPFAEWRTHDWSREPIASGPFLLQAHAPGQEIVLVRNPNAPEPAPLLDKVVVRIVPDVGSLVTQVEAGEIDYVEGVPPREFRRLPTNAGAPVKKYGFPYPMVDYLGWNEAKPPLDDPEVRRALTLGIDRQALVDELLGGLGKVAVGPLPSFFAGADATLAPLPYDPAESKRILAAKGYGEGGKPLVLEAVTNLGNRVREEALVRIQAQLAKIGVQLTPRPLEMASLRTRVSAGDFDATLAGWRWTGTPDLAPLFRSDARPPQGSNVVGYRSPEVDAALADASAAARWEDAQAALARVQAALHRDQPCTFLWETERLAVARERVHGVVPVPSDPLRWLATAWISR